MKVQVSQQTLLACAVALAAMFAARRSSPTPCPTPRPRSPNTPGRKPPGRARPRPRRRSQARRSSTCPATSRTTFPMLRRLHEGSRREARLELHRHRRQGQPGHLASRLQPGDRAEAERHRDLCRREEPAGPDQGRRGAGNHVHRPPRRVLPGPQPDLNLFVNIQEDPREIGKAEADWAIADTDGKARVVVVTHNEYPIAEPNRPRPRTKSRSAPAARCSTTSTPLLPKRRSVSRSSPRAGCSALGCRSMLPRSATMTLISPCRCCARAASSRTRRS